MAIKIGPKKYKCLFCDYVGTDAVSVDSHRDNEHDYVLVPMLREDLVRLQQYIFTGDKELLTKRLYDIIKQYSRFIPKAKQEDLQ